MSKHSRSPSREDVLRHPSVKRAKEIDSHTPLDLLSDLLSKEKPSSHKPRNVLHWFRSKDVRMEDNRALDAASQKAKEGSGALITCYLFSPRDMEWHGTSAARTDFILQSLQLLKDQLSEKHIPLACLTAEERGDKVSTLIDFVDKHDISHVYANLEYEVDELRRDIKFAKQTKEKKDLSFEAVHDQTVIRPGELTNASGGGPAKVFTPYHKIWVAEVANNPSLLDAYSDPEANETSVAKTMKELFDSKVPSLPDSKQYPPTQSRDRIRKLWPAGHSAAVQRLKYFLEKKAGTYARDRSEPAKDPTSRLSPYFAAGVLSVREALSIAKDYNEGSAHFSDSIDPGIAAWVREIVFREFYRHMLVLAPHGSMNLPQNLKFDNVTWEEDQEGWKKWCEGKTGMPFVDAGMRQLAHEAYMHNRLRMNVSSYLRTNLLLDYRRGERFFAESLIDWDLGNNTQGWEPSYTVFNPVSQAEKCDKDGKYIRKWVPELKDVEGKAVFDPSTRLGKKEFEKLGYPRPHVDFSETKQRAVGRYKQGIREADV